MEGVATPPPSSAAAAAVVGQSFSGRCFKCKQARS